MHRLINEKVDLVFEFLINQNRLLNKKELISNLKNILFSGFKDRWRKKNQKFDFSFSFSKSAASGLRFSYNNFGEKKEFYGKALKVFGLFGDVYDTTKLKKILDKLCSKKAVFQTTIGFEWKRGNAMPRFKIYFEEIHQELSKSERIKIIKKIAKIIGFNYEMLNLKASDDIGAICVDFLPQKETQLKIYLMLPRVDLHFLKKMQFGERKVVESEEDFLKSFSLEKSCFYYVAGRFSKGGLNSIKIYKIYEVAKICDFSESYREIFGFLKRFPAKQDLKKFKKLLYFAVKNKIALYPIISSMDFSLEGSVKFDLYLSINH